MKSDHGEIIACSLSVVDQTESETVKRLPLQRRLWLIAKAIQRAGYDRARLYRASSDGERMIGIAEAGGGMNVDPFGGFEISFKRSESLNERAVSKAPRLWSIDGVDDLTMVEVGATSDFILFPLRNQNQTIGWLSVDRQYTHEKCPLSEADIPQLIPYVEETRKALLEAEQGEDIDNPESTDLTAVWARIERCATPSEAMQVVLEAVRELTGCHSAFIQVKQGGHAVMVAAVGEFPRHRPERIRMENRYWTVQVIRSRQPIIVQNKERLTLKLMTEMDTWTDGMRAEFEHIKSFAIFPLKSIETFGGMNVLARNINHFTPERCAMLQSLADLAAMAWVDQSRAQDRRLAQSARLLTLGEVSGNIAHEVRNTMQVVNGYVDEILRKAELAGKYEKKLKRVQSSGLEIVHVMEKFLVLGRGGAFRPAEFQTFDLHEAIEIALGALTSRLEHKRIEIDRAFDIQDAALTGDPAQIQHVVVNLVTNALDAIIAAKRPGELSIYTEGNQETLSFSVTDNGIGMDESQMARLFEVGYTTKPRGTGIGLSVCQVYIEQIHGGTIQAQSQPDAGTTFTVEIPRKHGTK